MASQESQGIKLFGQTITLIGSKPTKTKEQITINTQSDPTVVMKRPDKIIACPRCKSMETKFCYFNNYNVNQPRHFCKGCQRYWTAGGALRNVPVGAGRRKNKPPGYGGDQPAETTVYGSGEAHKAELVESLLAVEEWQVAAATAAIEAHRGYLHGGFQVKRPRCYYSDGQSC